MRVARVRGEGEPFWTSEVLNEAGSVASTVAAATPLIHGEEDQEQGDRERQGGRAAISAVVEGLRGQRGGGGAAAAFDEPPLPSQQAQEDQE